MALTYNATKIGEISLKDSKGRAYKVQIRQGNCLAVLLYVRKPHEDELERNPEAKKIHELWSFYGDEQHLKNILKNEGDVLFHAHVTGIRLNVYYKECNTLLKYFALSGHKVTCYYEQPKAK